MKVLSYITWTVLIVMLTLWAWRAGLADRQFAAAVRYAHAVIVFLLAPYFMRWFGNGKLAIVTLLALVGGTTGLVFQVLGLMHACRAAMH